MGRYVIGITGASGVIYGNRLTGWLLDHGHQVHLVVSDPGRLVMRDELGIPADIPLRELFTGGSLITHENRDIGAVIASGSFRHDGMIVIPCTMSTLAGIAQGTSKNLIERAADVSLKENRPLLLVPRETPLNLIHLRNLTAAAEAGAKIIPAMPAFYHRPETMMDLIDFLVGKVLDQLGLEHHLFHRYLDKS
ncbi:MAG: UbiX family flavin prenyltransferase [Solirubrobacterales bacterium]